MVAARAAREGRGRGGVWPSHLGRKTNQVPAVRCEMKAQGARKGGWQFPD